jgi:ribosome-binding ATPase YchF (GTP1/OBG family)
MENGYTSIKLRTLLSYPYKYIIDTCSILSQRPDEPHRRNVYSSLWTKIDEIVEKKSIVTCSEIEDELEDADMQSWLKQHACVVLGIDDDIQRNVTKIVNEHPEMIGLKKVKSSGDAFLIATAMKYSLTVITEENKHSYKKIPEICKV